MPGVPDCAHPPRKWGIAIIVICNDLVIRDGIQNKSTREDCNIPLSKRSRYFVHNLKSYLWNHALSYPWNDMVPYLWNHMVSNLWNRPQLIMCAECFQYFFRRISDELICSWFKFTVFFLAGNSPNFKHIVAEIKQLNTTATTTTKTKDMPKTWTPKTSQQLAPTETDTWRIMILYSATQIQKRCSTSVESKKTRAD
jgi:hypothetical protein